MTSSIKDTRSFSSHRCDSSGLNLREYFSVSLIRFHRLSQVHLPILQLLPQIPQETKKGGSGEMTRRTGRSTVPSTKKGLVYSVL